jgi:hypothetical protein
MPRRNSEWITDTVKPHETATYRDPLLLPHPQTGRADARAIAHAASRAGADAHADTVLPAIREAQDAGAKSLREIAAALNVRGVSTARGGKWEATTVRNILRRAA